MVRVMPRCTGVLLVAAAVAHSCNIDTCIASAHEDDAISLIQVRAKASHQVGRELLGEQDDESDVQVEMYSPPNIGSQLVGGSSASDTSSNTSDVVFNCERDYLLVYTLGKTGSTTFEDSFFKLCGDHHRIKWVNKPQDEPLHPNAKAIKTQIMGAQVAKDFLEKIPPRSNVWILTFVRDPFARMQSAFFQIMWKKIGEDNAENMKLQELSSKFHKYVAGNMKAHTPYTTFWSSFSQTIGVDILSKSFDFDAKKIFISEPINQRNQRTLLLRLEDVDQWSTILAPHFGGFELVVGNDSTEKWYRDLYEQFKSQFVWNRAEIDQLSTVKELQFYTQDEIQKFKHSHHVSDD